MKQNKFDEAIRQHPNKLFIGFVVLTVLTGVAAFFIASKVA